MPEQTRYFARPVVQQVDLAFHTIAKIEAGETPNLTIETVKKITNAHGVSLDDLIK